uniref:glycoside hydrolase family 55 protein n=1 Tax=Lactiplantibacillus pentosus TaxID=1589 RepID=UPI0020A753F3|nr:glycoside hydrolase family 55 protein [Lactiplantibacillus pentosus]
MNKMGRQLIYRFVAISLWVCVNYLFMFYIVGAADTTINVKNEGMSANPNVTNNNALQKIIDTHRHEPVIIYVPKGDYAFSKGVIVLHSNITFKFASGAVFTINNGQLVSFSYPSVKAGYDGGVGNISWVNATFRGTDVNGQSGFVQSMNHAQNISFDRCVFYNSEYSDGHDLDIDGSHNIRITNSSFFGFNANPSADYKEAIQIDYSNKKAISYILQDDKYDNLPSYDIYVSNNRFLPIIRQGKIKYYAPNPIGQHMIYNNGKNGIIHDIYFVNNLVSDPKPRQQAQTGIVNFEGVSNVFIFNNYFRNEYVAGPATYVRIHNPLPRSQMSGVYIRKNIFYDVNPTKQYILVQAFWKNNYFKNVFIENNEVVTNNMTKFITKNDEMVSQKENHVLDILAR